MSMRVVHVNDKIEGAIYIGRAVSRRGIGASPFGNPFKPGKDGTRSEVMARYQAWLDNELASNPAFAEQVRALAGKTLACWCRHAGEQRTANNACHGDYLAEAADRLAREPA